MQVSVENTGKLGRKIHVELPDERVSGEINKRLQRLSKTTKVQGFRPGKVPLKVVQGRYGGQIRKEVVGELVQSSFYEAITQEKLQPAGPPQIEDIADESGKNLVYTAIFEVYPEVTLNPIEKLELETPVCEVGEEDITRMIARLRQQRRSHRPVERAAKDGDIVDINFEGYVDGAVFEGGKAENYQLELGSNSFIEGFEAGLMGRSADEAVTLKIHFPEDYGNEKLKGKPVEFNVQVNSVNEPVLPEIDAAFMENFGVKDGNETTFRNEIKRNMDREVELTLKRQIKDIVLDKLNEGNNVELPLTLVENGRQQLRQELKNNLQQQGLDAGALAKADPALFNEQAEKRVSLQLLIGEIIRQNDIKADPAKVRTMIEQAAAAYEDPSAIVDRYYADKKNLQEVEALALEQAVVDWILVRAKVSEKACTFDEIMNKGQTAG